MGLKLALIGSINDQILNKDELACELIRFLKKRYPQVLSERFGLETEGKEAAFILEGNCQGPGLPVKRRGSGCVQGGSPASG